MEEKFDCIIVGGGIAGLSTAMVLARRGICFLLIERGEYFGTKNVSGGVLWGADLARLVPDYNLSEGGIERFVNHRRLTLMDEESGFSVDFKSLHFNELPYSGVTVLRSKFDRWLASKVEEAIESGPNPDGSFLTTNILVDELVLDSGRVTGIRAGNETILANVVVLAEGVNNLLTRQVELEPGYVDSEYMAVGIKEVIRLGQSVVEDRFQLNGLSGFANEFVGISTDGVEGGGFLYTNLDSVSIGLVIGMDGLREKQRTPYDLLDQFKTHTIVADMIRGGDVLEYSAHTVSTGHVKAVPKRLYADGVLVTGEAAHLLLNAGRAIQGMDYAMRSGILAAEAVCDATERNDYSTSSLKDYQTALENSYVLQDMNNFQDAVSLLHKPAMHRAVPDIVCDFGRSFFTIGNEPSEKSARMLRASIKRHASYWELVKLGVRAARAL